MGKASTRTCCRRTKRPRTAWAWWTCKSGPFFSAEPAPSPPFSAEGPKWPCPSLIVARPILRTVKKSKNQKIKILLVDDHPIVLEGIKSHLSNQPDLRVVGEASNGQQALRQARQCAPDVILMDISMPHMNGLEAIARMRKVVPSAKV